MEITRLKQVRRAFPHLPGVPASTTRYNRRAWVRVIRQLGDKWVYIKLLQQKGGA